MSLEGLSPIFFKRFFRTLTARSEAEFAVRYNTGPRKYLNFTCYLNLFKGSKLLPAAFAQASFSLSIRIAGHVLVTPSMLSIFEEIKFLKSWEFSIQISVISI